MLGRSDNSGGSRREGNCGGAGGSSIRVLADGGGRGGEGGRDGGSDMNGSLCVRGDMNPNETESCFENEKHGGRRCG